MKKRRNMIVAIQVGRLSFGRRVRWLLLGCFLLGIVFACGQLRHAGERAEAERVKAAVQDTLPFYSSESCKERLIVFPESPFQGEIAGFFARTWRGTCQGVSDVDFSVNILTCEVTLIHFTGNTIHKLAWCP